MPASDSQIVEHLLHIQELYKRFHACECLRHDLKSRLRKESRVLGHCLRNRSRSPHRGLAGDNGSTAPVSSSTSSAGSSTGDAPGGSAGPSSLRSYLNDTGMSGPTVPHHTTLPMSVRPASWWRALDWDEFCASLIVLAGEEDSE